MKADTNNKKKDGELSRKERTYREHKASIMKAALDLFAQKGFRKTGMKDIAECAEFGTGTIYNFFKNKQELFDALFVSYTENYYEAIRTALRNGRTEIEQLESYLTEKGEYFRNDLNLIRLLFAEGWGMSFNLAQRTSSRLQRLQEQFLVELAEVFEKGIKKGVFEDYDPRHLALSLEGQSNMYLFVWIAYADSPEYPGLIEEILRIFLFSVASGGHSIGDSEK